MIHLLYDADETPSQESAKRARVEPKQSESGSCKSLSFSVVVDLKLIQYMYILQWLSSCEGMQCISSRQA